ncbi:DUF3304 domain-containing protein [Cupriavidus sp. NPDC089707]|uniref:DUF3304 domain-containing protein n=1 Tax=Cupriavidus sp. NPDC089707 TaxID=3363963 RepID=UPI00382499DA
MSVFRLPNAMPETDKGRLPEGLRAYENGKTTVSDPLGPVNRPFTSISFSTAPTTTATLRRAMTTNSWSRKRARPWLAALVMLGALSALSACSDDSRPDLSDTAAGGADKEKINPGGVRALNYSSNGIYSFSVTGPRGMNGGGGDMNPASPEGPSQPGEVCCIGIPQPWQPNTQLRIERERDRKPFDYKDRSGLAVLTATVTVPEYGPETYGFWAIFLPGDRVKVMVMDGNANGHNSVRTKPAVDDPFVV